MKEWDSSNVIMTGNSDGVVRVCSVVFCAFFAEFTAGMASFHLGRLPMGVLYKSKTSQTMSL